MSNEALRRLAYWALDVAAGRIDPDTDPFDPDDYDPDDRDGPEEEPEDAI